MILVEVRDYEQLHAAFRARAEELSVSRETIDHVSGLHAGYSSKLLSPIPTKRVGPVSLGPLLGALGLKLIVAEDPEALTKLGDRLVRKQQQYNRSAKAGQAPSTAILDQAQSLLRSLMSENGRRGARALNGSRTPEKRSKAARRAARARWRKANRAGKPAI